MIEIVDFNSGHVRDAERIARESYERERGFVPALPAVDSMPDLTPFAQNGLGVAAFEGGAMVGFLCSVSPFKNAFRSTDATGVFSPMGANGAADGRPEIYARMYQAAGEKWARAGASSHAVCLYAHDTQSQAQFFRYGFGMRCIDAVRDMSGIASSPADGYEFAELEPNEFINILPLDHMLDEHMAASPCFILRPSDTEESFLEKTARKQSRFFAAKKDGEIAAYIRAEHDGETFICDTPGYTHVMGAFCLPEHRGRGVYPNLLSLLISTLKSEGYKRIGVDYESINPTAYGFWRKYFSPYTHGLTRRIDEHALRR